MLFCNVRKQIYVCEDKLLTSDQMTMCIILDEIITRK